MPPPFVPGLETAGVVRYAPPGSGFHAGHERRRQLQLVLTLAQQQVRKAHAGSANVDDDLVAVIGNIVDIGIDYAGWAGKLLYDTGFHANYSLNPAFCAPDRSVISAQCAATSCTEGGVSKVTPAFWNNAARCTLPPPTMNTDALSAHSSVHR